MVRWSGTKHGQVAQIQRRNYCGALEWINNSTINNACSPTLKIYAEPMRCIRAHSTKQSTAILIRELGIMCSPICNGSILRVALRFLAELVGILCVCVCARGTVHWQTRLKPHTTFKWQAATTAKIFPVCARGMYSRITRSIVPLIQWSMVM